MYQYTPVAPTSSQVSFEDVLIDKKEQARTSACRKMWQGLPLLIVFAGVAFVVLWLTGVFSNVWNPVDPTPDPPVPPPSPAVFNHTVGPLVPSDEFVMTLPNPVQAVAVDISGMYVYTVSLSTGTISLSMMDHVFMVQTLVDPSAAVTPYPNPTVLYVSVDGDGLYVGYSGTNCVSRYAIDTATGELTYMNQAFFGSSGQGVSAIIDGGFLNFVMVVDTSTSLTLFAVDLSSGQLIIQQTQALASTGLALAIDDTGQVLYVLHATEIHAWSLMASLSSPFTSLISDLGTVASITNPVASLWIVDQVLYSLQSGSVPAITLHAIINNTTGQLSTLTTIDAPSSPSSFATTGKFIYSWSASTGILYQHELTSVSVPTPLTPPFVRVPLTTVSGYMLLFPNNDAVAVYPLGATTAYQYVIM